MNPGSNYIFRTWDARVSELIVYPRTEWDGRSRDGAESGRDAGDLSCEVIEKGVVPGN
jgi:hypothetical protein